MGLFKIARVGRIQIRELPTDFQEVQKVIVAECALFRGYQLPEIFIPIVLTDLPKQDKLVRFLKIDTCSLGVLGSFLSTNIGSIAKLPSFSRNFAGA